MEFWGVEVKAGEPLQIEPEDGMVIHLSQAVLGEPKIKGNEPVVLHVKVDDKKLVLGMLSSDKFPQLSFDLVFEKEFELSHNWKNGSIHFAGYQTALGDQPEDFGGFDESDSEEEDVVPENPVVNGKGGQKGEQPKPAAVAKTAVAAKPGPSEKPKAKVEQPAEDDDDSDDDNDSDDSSDGEDSDDDSDEDMIGGDNDDDEDSDDESDEETPKKVGVSKKRANDSASKTPVPAKKAKANSPKSDGKKVGGHTATPHPAKKVGKTPVTPATDKSKAQTPKSGGISCKSCSKTFGSDKALESHTKAKHA